MAFKPTQADKGEREAFEAWMLREWPNAFPLTVRPDGEYDTPSVEASWRGWQAHAALATQPQAEQAVVVGTIQHGPRQHPYAVLSKCYQPNGDVFAPGTKLYAGAAPVQPEAVTQERDASYEECAQIADRVASTCLHPDEIAASIREARTHAAGITAIERAHGIGTEGGKP